MRCYRYRISVLFITIGIYLLSFPGCASDSLIDRSGFSASDHYNFGLNWLESSELQRAEKSFQKAIELNSEFGDAYIQLGIVYYILYEREAAVNINRNDIPRYYNQSYNCFQMGIKYSPKNPLGYASIARLQIIGNQLDRAVTNLLKAQELTSPDDISTDIIISYELGGCYLAQGKYQQAIAEYSNYLQLVPVGSEHDNIESIIKEIEKQLEANPTR
jgi:tetratricopeptide (TPR) repeat protein